MSTHQVEQTTRRGDRLVVTLIDEAGAEPTILLTVDDVDQTPLPTVELTIDETAALRETLRALCERALANRGGDWWTRRR